MPDPALHLTLVGGPTLLVELEGLRLLTDPTFDPPGTHAARTPGAVPLTKTAGPALPPEALGPLDAVLLSHDQHADNLDAGGRALLARVPRVFTTRAGAARLGAADGLAPWERRTLRDRAGRAWTVTGTPARHGPPGIEPVTGEVTGFVLTAPDGADVLYVTGDTVWYEGTAEVARRFRPALVVLFAGAAEPRGPFHVTMDSNDALEAAHAFPDARLAAIHQDGWAHFTRSAADLARAFGALGQAGRLVELERGRRTRVALRRAAIERHEEERPGSSPLG